MKILAFVDLHGSKKSLAKLKKRAKKVDLVVCAGDFTIFGSDEKSMIEEMDKFGKPVFLIHGNHEDDSEVRKECKKAKNVIFIHSKKVQFGEFLFIGWGGGGFSTKDKGFEKFSKGLKREKGERWILVTHAPPYNTKIDHIYEESAGCRSFRKFIEKEQPEMAISGHLHENAGKYDKIKKCFVINPGHEGRILRI